MKLEIEVVVNGSFDMTNFHCHSKGVEITDKFEILERARELAERFTIQELGTHLTNPNITAKIVKIIP